MQPVFGRLGEDFEQLSNMIRAHGEDSRLRYQDYKS